MMNRKIWTGSAVWRQEGDPFPIRKASGAAALLLDQEGGLLRAGPTFPKSLRVDVRFGWDEVEKVERMRYFGIPFVGEAVRFTLKEGSAGTGQSTFSFGGLMTKITTNQIFDFVEAEGVKVERKPKIKMVQP
jgi:hypothetical protein